MKTEANKISCPHCGSQIDVDEILAKPLEGQLRQQLSQEQRGA